MRSFIKYTRLALVALAALLVAGLSSVGSVSAATQAAKIPDQRADVAVVAKPTLSNGGLNYAIITTNGGKSPALNTTITVPFDASKLQLVNVNFTGAGAWVTDIQPSAFTVQIQRLNSGGDFITVNAHFAQLASLPTDTPLGGRVAYHWNDKTGSNDGLSNLPMLSSASTFALSASPASAAAKTVRVFKSNPIFTPGELVTMWYSTPAGKSVELEVKGNRLIDANSTKSEDNGGDFVTADANGAISAQFSSENLAPGTYTMVARGNRTGFVAVASFQVQ